MVMDFEDLALLFAAATFHGTKLFGKIENILWPDVHKQRRACNHGTAMPKDHKVHSDKMAQKADELCKIHPFVLVSTCLCRNVGAFCQTDARTCTCTSVRMSIMF